MSAAAAVAAAAAAAAAAATTTAATSSGLEVVDVEEARLRAREGALPLDVLLVRARALVVEVEVEVEVKVEVEVAERLRGRLAGLVGTVREIGGDIEWIVGIVGAAVTVAMGRVKEELVAMTG
jgi:hypothetical protein